MKKIIITEKQEKIIKTNTKPEVFLGGTCNNSEWRGLIIPKLNINYYNPVVKDWKPSDGENEIQKRKTCSHVLYTITPKMDGVLSIAEVVEDSIKQSDKTLFCVLEEDGDNKFTTPQIKSLEAVKNMVSNNGAKVFNNLNEVINYLNK